MSTDCSVVENVVVGAETLEFVDAFAKARISRFVVAGAFASASAVREAS